MYESRRGKTHRVNKKKKNKKPAPVSERRLMKLAFFPPSFSPYTYTYCLDTPCRTAHDLCAIGERRCTVFSPLTFRSRQTRAFTVAVSYLRFVRHFATRALDLRLRVIALALRRVAQALGAGPAAARQQRQRDRHQCPPL